ncbi:hypothetical protein Hanom_Chr12g01125551 [Helianthus anomalus]
MTLKVEEVLVENKKLVDREKKLEKRVKIVEAENSSLLKKVEADQVEIDIMKVKIVELEDEKARIDEQNKYFKLKNKELEAANAKKVHEMFMINKVLENLIGASIEQKFEEIQVEEVRARRQAKIDAEMKNKGKSVKGTTEVTERAIVSSVVSESPIQNPRPISAMSGIFEEYVLIDDGINDEEEVDEDDDEEDDDEDKVDDADDVFSASSHSYDDDDDEDGQEEGEIRHTYTMADIIKMTQIDDPNFKFEFEDELNAFDINQQPDYQYKDVEEADNYDRVEVKDCNDEESMNADTSNFPTLVELFSQENIDELRRKEKWFTKSSKRKFKRPLKYYKRDRDVSLGDIISWGFLPQVNLYAIRREYGVQYFEYIQDIMSLPWWDVEEVSKVRTLDYPVRKHDVPIWGLIKFEAFRGFEH